MSSVARHDRVPTYSHPCHGEYSGTAFPVACHNSVVHNSCICTFGVLFPRMSVAVGGNRCLSRKLLLSTVSRRLALDYSRHLRFCIDHLSAVERQGTIERDRLPSCSPSMSPNCFGRITAGKELPGLPEASSSFRDPEEKVDVRQHVSTVDLGELGFVRRAKTGRHCLAWVNNVSRAHGKDMPSDGKHGICRGAWDP